MKKDTLLNLVLTVALAAPLGPISARSAAGDLYVTKVNGSIIGGSISILKFAPDGTSSIFDSDFDTLSNILEGLAFDRAGNLFVADVGTAGIYRFTPDGTKSTFASGLGAYGLAFDRAGNLFAADRGSGTIFKFTPDGTRSTFTSAAGAAFGLAFDHAGNLFVADIDSNAIYKFNPDGSKSTFASGLNIPADLAFDSGGNLFVADFGSGSILKFTPAGTRSTFASGLRGPGGLAFDGAGNLFATANGGILKFTPAGAKSVFAPEGESFLAFEPEREKLRNVSARGLVQGGDNVLIGGFIVGGNALATNAVVVRAIGPSLSNSGIASPLPDPILELHNASGTLIASNDNWQDTQAAQITESGLAPADAHESVIVATLPAGNFTAVVRGVGAATGVAVVEVYSTQ